MNAKNKKNLQNKIHSQIKKSRKIAILVSEPDQDSIGSGLALKDILNLLGKDSDLYSSFPLDKFKYLPNIKQYIIRDIGRLPLARYDTIFVLDASQTYRLVDVKKYPEGIAFPDQACIINIDHHQDNPKFGNINYISKYKFSSTAEALYEIFHTKVAISPSIATNLLAGLIEDTGCFRHAFTSQTLRFVADLIDQDGNYAMLVSEIYYSNPINMVKANVKSLSTLKMKNVGKYTYAYIILTPEDFGVEEVRRSDVRILQETMKSLSGIDFSMRITQVSKQITDISFRSREVKVSDIAKHFHGGGHDRAAGATIRMDIETFLKELDELLHKITLEKVRYL